MLYNRQVDIASQLVTFYSQPRGNQPHVLNLTFKMPTLSKKSSSTIFNVFGMSPLGIELTTSRTPGERSTTEPQGAVLYVM